MTHLEKQLGLDKVLVVEGSPVVLTIDAWLTLRAERAALRQAVEFLAAAVKAGRPWDTVCEQHMIWVNSGQDSVLLASPTQSASEDRQS